MKPVGKTMLILSTDKISFPLLLKLFFIQPQINYHAIDGFHFNQKLSLVEIASSQSKLQG